MGLGLEDKLSILQQSPLDQQPPGTWARSADDSHAKTTWVPSRYNVRATTTDGQLVVWNSYEGTMSVFGAEQGETVRTLLSCQKGFEAGSVGLVKYLADRGYLIPEGTDELRRVLHAFGRQNYRTDLLELILLSSEDCNFRCQYCYEDFARGTMLPRVRSAVKKLVRRRLPALQRLSVSWFGGEPLYGFPAIEDLAPFFVEVTEEAGIPLSNSMTTNGYLLTPDVAGKLLSWQVNKFQITIDGTPEDHDRNRPARNGDSTFWAIFENLKALRERPERFAVDLRVNFDQRNHGGVGEFLDLVKSELGDDRRFGLMFRAVGKWGGANDKNLQVCGADESLQIRFDLQDEARRRGLRVADDIREVQGSGSQVCYAARPYNFIVGADGHLMKCTIDLDRKDRNIVGRLTDEGELELDDDKMALWTEPAFTRDTKCQKCVVLPNCQGVHCPQIRLDHDKSPCTPLRMNAKRELRAVAEAKAATARQVTVDSKRKSEASLSV